MAMTKSVDEIYHLLIRECPNVASKMYQYAMIIERAYTDPTQDISIYEVNGKCRKIKAWMIQDNATKFLNIYEGIK